MFMDIIFNGEMWRTANHKMTVIGRCFCDEISQISESASRSVVLQLHQHS